MLYYQNKKIELNKLRAIKEIVLVKKTINQLKEKHYDALKNLDKSIINQHFEMDSILKTIPDLPKINYNNWQERLKSSN